MRRFLGTYLLLCALLIAAWQCFAQLPMTHAGKGAPSSGGGCSQATTVNAALDGSQNSSAVTTAVCGMVTDGDYANLVGLYVFAASSAANALINWAAPGTNNAVKNGTCTFNTNASYQGDASTCFFTTGIIISTIGNSVGQNSTTLGTCVVNARSTSNTSVELGAQSASGANWAYIQPLLTGTFGFELNAGNFPSFSNSAANASWIIVRSGSANIAVFKNGSAVAGSPFTDASAAAVDHQILLFGASDSGSGHQDLSSDSLAYDLIGNGSISASNIRARLNTYVGAIGADSC